MNPDTSRKQPSSIVLSMECIGRLSELRVLQGKDLSQEEAEHLHGLQRSFVEEALKEGFNTVAKAESSEVVPSFAEQIGRIEDFSAQLRTAEKDLEQVNSILEGMENLYKEIHQNPQLNDRQKLFLEFFLGLCCVDINIKIGLQIAQDMAKERPEDFEEGSRDRLLSFTIENSDGNILEALKAAEPVAREVGDILQQNYSGRAERFWKACTEALKNNPTLDQLAKKVVSMRFIPDGDGKDIEGIAQFLHWSGFGGTGEFLKKTPELSTFSDHAIAWHRGSEEQSHFSQRMKLFGDVITPLKQYEAKVLAELIKTQLQNSGESEITMLDFGAGPIAKGSHLFLETLGPQTKVTLDASDVDGKSIASLSKLKGEPVRPDLSNTRVRKSLRIDANQDWRLPENTYDLVVSSIVLHQVMDAEKGEDLVAKTLCSMTACTKIGGFIAWSDAGEHAYIQSPVIPFNVADREGGVPADILERVSFYDLAVPTRTTKATEYYDETRYFKVPVRFSALRHATPESVVSEHGTGIYESNIFQVVEVDHFTLDLLEQHKADPEECQKILDQVRSQDTRILEIRKDLREEVLDAL